jgi:hypothetical protein
MKARMQEQLVVDLQNKFGPLFAANGLSDESSKEACALMVAQQMEMMDKLRPSPGSPPPPLSEVEKLRIGQQEQLREKLGDKAYGAFRQFNRDRKADRMVSQLEESARSSDVAFTKEQLDQVRTVLAKERVVPQIDVSKLPPIDLSIPPDSQSLPAGPLPEVPENPVLQESRTILNPEQLRLLENVLKAPPTRAPRRR